ncbi:hypothetical protein PybrP1_008792 [[Pythium] brassicae (nom. inval.)]|nr:hypothetical protein PybrP1_008792 [[Pythium] brassicae (nom. inval.)]
MSSSCLLPAAVPAAIGLPASPRLLKRARSSSSDRLCLDHILKVCKRSDPASPHSPVGCHPLAPQQARQPFSRSIPADVTTDAPSSLSPLLQACSSMKAAIPFLQNSRRHALGLLLQNQCERALHVLEKIERANDMISRQRRRFVVEQANAIHQYVLAHPEEQLPVTAAKPKKAVRFCEQVAVVAVEAMDRSPAPMPPLIREEILVLRASRPIPFGNFSELWN